ncbi:hypothetical protein BDR26DRAFT_850049 [Obelidium mucronatum]|nr:hypothetical protein BDR26DRAFT_850049 [Obelidium mucronatum]
MLTSKTRTTSLALSNTLGHISNQNPIQNQEDVLGDGGGGTGATLSPRKHPNTRHSLRTSAQQGQTAQNKKRDAPESDEEEEEDDEFGLVSAFKRTKISAERAVKARKRASSSTATSRRGPLPSRPPTIPRTIQEGTESSSDDDLGGSTKPKKHSEFDSSDAPAGHLQDDEGSDYYPSDVEETGGVVGTTCASVERRIQRGLTTVERMANYFAQTMPNSSRNLFDPATGRPFFVFARLRKWVDDVEAGSGENHTANLNNSIAGKARKGRWSEKGPVVVMILPCSEERPWEARVVAHYTFGTQTAAVNMPISDIHPMFIHTLTPRKTLFSSLNNNIQAHAIISSEPRRIHEFLASNLTTRDAKLLNDLQTLSLDSAGGVAKQNADLAIAVAERLESVALNESGISIAGPSRRRLTRSGSKVLSQHRGGPSGESSNESSGACTPAVGSTNGDNSGNTTNAMIERRKTRDPVAASADFLYECRSTIVPVLEEKSSVFMLHFGSRADSLSFNHRFVKAAQEFAAYLTEIRVQSFLTPQLVKRVLLSGQTVVIPGGLVHTSPFIVDHTLARQIAETGLMYIPVVADACSQAVQHRLVCMHCHAALAVLTQTNVLPSLEAVCVAHAGHSFAKRVSGGSSGGRGKKVAVSGGSIQGIYRCVYAAKGVSGTAFEADPGSATGGSKKGWDLVIIN